MEQIGDLALRLRSVPESCMRLHPDPGGPAHPACARDRHTTAMQNLQHLRVAPLQRALVHNAPLSLA